MFLVHQISILELFLKDRVTLKTGLLIKIQLCITGINYILKYIKNSAVKLLITINHIQNKCFCLHNTCVCTVYIYYAHTHIYIYTVYIYIHIYIITHMHVYI